MAGRFTDFWKPNDDITIHGTFVSWSPQHEFAIEPIDEDKLEGFWKTHVRPDEPTPSPAEILKSVGFFVPDRMGRVENRLDVRDAEYG
jgi:hypothetical protein